MRTNSIKKFICMAANLLIIVATIHFAGRIVYAEPSEDSGSVMAGSISIQLLDGQGAPYVGITAWLIGELDEDVIATAESNGEGYVIITGVPVGNYRLRVSAQDASLGFYNANWSFVNESETDTSIESDSDTTEPAISETENTDSDVSSLEDTLNQDVDTQDSDIENSILDENQTTEESQTGIDSEIETLEEQSEGL